MRFNLLSYALVGIEAVPMDVLVDRDRASVVESEIGRCRDAVRPRTTLPGSPRKEQVVNFRTLAPGRSAPADLKKDANGFDLPIALGLLLASGQVAFDRPGNFAIVGELALTGETRPIKGILAMALQAVSEGRDGLLVPTANAAEAAVVEGLNVYPVGVNIRLTHT